MTALTPGDVVRDRGSPEGRAIVVNTPPKRASEWHVPGRGFLDEDNPDYPANDPVVIAVWRQDLRETLPYYSGSRPLPMQELQSREMPYYAFPETRLTTVTSLPPPTLPLDRIGPSPFHARNFDASANEGFIRRMRERGTLPYPPLVRVHQPAPNPEHPLKESDFRFEIINGHKRIWAAHVAGFRTVHCWCLHIGEEEAARKWAERHLGDDPVDLQAVACRRLKDHLPEAVAEELIVRYARDYLLDTGAVDAQSQLSRRVV